MQVETLLRRSIREKPASKRSARQKTSTPRDMVRMNLNENAYGMSDTVQQALRASVADNSMYQDFYAYDIRKKVADLHGLTADHILIGAGSSAVIDMLGEVFINYGDEVLYCSPTYEAFPDMVSDNGGVRVEVPLTADYRFDLAALRAAVTDKTKMVILVNPNNPTGTCLPAAEVEAFVRSLPDHVLAVVDEAYFEYVDTPGHYSLIRLVQQGYGKPLIVLRTFSKIYGLAGLRIGYAVADPALIDQLMKACQAWNVSRIATLAATVALDDQAYVEKVRAANTIERQRLYSGLRALGCTVAEPAANFLYFDTGRDAAAVSGALAGRRILIGTPNARFNRVTVGMPAENAAFLQALAEVLDTLPKRAT